MPEQRLTGAAVTPDAGQGAESAAEAAAKTYLEISKTYVGNFRFQRRKFKALGTGDISLSLTRHHEPPSRLRHGSAA